MDDYIKREDFLAQRRKIYCENCNRRKGMRNGKLKTLYEIGDAPCRACAINDVLNDVEDFPAADVVEVVWCKDCKYSYDGLGGYTCSHGVCVDCIVPEDFWCREGVLDNG